MSREELLALAERCEAAEGPSEDLFWDAWRACYPKPAEIWAVLGETWTADYTEWQERQIFWSCFIDADAWLDAAMTLVPDGAFWSLTMRGENRGGFQACCQFEGPLDWRDAATPALALCAASLRARTEERQP